MMPGATASRLRRAGGKVIRLDGHDAVQILDQHGTRRQYRRRGKSLEARTLPIGARESVPADLVPWVEVEPDVLTSMYLGRGRFHPILDPLGL